MVAPIGFITMMRLSSILKVLEINHYSKNFPQSTIEQGNQ